jgi:hypothetical protein
MTHIAYVAITEKLQSIFFLQWPQYYDIRQHFVNEVSRIIYNISLNMNVILYGASDLSIEENYSIVDAFHLYRRDSGRCRTTRGAWCASGVIFIAAIMMFMVVVSDDGTSAKHVLKRCFSSKNVLKR